MIRTKWLLCQNLTRAKAQCPHKIRLKSKLKKKNVNVQHIGGLKSRTMLTFAPGIALSLIVHSDVHLNARIRTHVLVCVSE